MQLRPVYRVAVALALGLPAAVVAPPVQAQQGSCLPAGTHTVAVRGYPVRIHVPPVRTRTVPVVLDLHPSNGNAERQAAYNDLDSLADRQGFVTVRPNGAIPAADPNPDRIWFWNVPGVPTVAGEYSPPDARDDIDHLTAVIETSTRLVCADRRRVYLTGHSGGARMTSAFACARPDLVAAIAPVAGLRAGRPAPDDPSVPELQSCTPRLPVPVVAFHGTADTVNPYPGNADLRWGYGVALAAQTWARLNRCTTGPTARPVSEHVTLLGYAGCGRADVQLYRITGGTHSWPGSAVDPSASQEIEANELIWDFFSRHARP